jgi:PAS domain S-box-containing protein
MFRRSITLLTVFVALIAMGGLVDSQISHAFETVPITSTVSRQPLGKSLWYWEDPTGEVSIDYIKKAIPQEKWQKSSRQTPTFSYTSSAYWFTVILQNRDPKPLQRLLEIAYPVLDSIDVYLQSEDGAFSVQRSGDRLPFASRPIKHRYFLFPVNLDPYQTKQLYVRVHTVSAMQVPLILWSERTFWITDQQELLVHAVYFGTMLVMVLYNLFIYLSVRDKSYLYYVAFVMAFALFQGTLHGFSYHYLWPGQPWLNNKMLGVTVSAAICFGVLFTTELLRLRSNYRRLYQALYGLAVITGTNALAAFFIPYHNSVLISLVTSLMSCCLGLTAGLLTWRRGYPPACYYTFAWACFLIGACTFALNKFGILPANLITENAMQLGSALEVVLLSFALANRISVARQKKEQAQTQALDILQKYRSLYENAVEGIFQCLPDFRFVHVNRAMVDMLGFPDAEIFLSHATATLNYCFADPLEATRFCTRLAAEGTVSEYESCGQRQDGSGFWGYWSVHGVYDAAGNLLHYEGSVIDISVRKEKEQAEQARKLAEDSARTKNQFLATMSHEIRTPLNGVLGMTDLLLTTSLTHQQRHYADTVRRSGKHLMGIINDILDLAKIEAGKLELQDTPFDLRLLLEDLAELFAERAQRKGLELICSIPPVFPWTFYGDAARLNQILINLVGNGIKFTQQGQVVIRLVSAIDVDTDTHNDTDTFSQTMVHLAIEDSGPGVEAAQQACIFESFSQADNTPSRRRHEGSGLGLTIAKQLVELMGGQIGLDSLPGSGSTFWFTVRLGQRSAPSTPQNEKPLHNVHLLMVDNNDLHRQQLICQVEAWGMRQTVAANGRQALQLLRANSNQGNTFDMVLLDRQLPDMDGLELAQSIKANPTMATLPLLLMTRLSDFNLDIRQPGIAAYLPKPIRQSQLYECLLQVLSPSANPSKSQSPPINPDRNLKGRVLVVEDNPVNAEIACTVIESFGCHTQSAEDGYKALDLLAREDFDLILMDCHMPGLDGYGATAEIRQREKPLGNHIPIVALTANAMANEREHCLAVGMDDYLSKPFTPEQLHNVLQQWLTQQVGATT